METGSQTRLVREIYHYTFNGGRGSFGLFIGRLRLALIKIINEDVYILDDMPSVKGENSRLDSGLSFLSNGICIRMKQLTRFNRRNLNKIEIVMYKYIFCLFLYFVML